ncbi:putative mitochondrial hypothetical protein [Leptomonas pyrrhocoris]|uniref:Uncharacterized protein n=1 Tax=Leptomonas pyrrhocoris TaxID=157538 RepID=A0A0M9FQW1_LEPPY|nr:putative mitochondrial hypothetical protein [Leptomonas pyrrhocoris]KPA74079.1 putative mitochondrial hypothetical protein [Leptomonas pyrrhocoris]|eukprot:XP_015652518.1 putative mitochondrial hypothetical protein [Leptomonas pyrrhocoris]
MRRQRAVVVCVAALRSITAQHATSSDSVNHLDAPTATARGRPAGIRADQHDISAVAAVRRSPADTSAAAGMYSGEGYNSIEHLRTSGASAALGRVQWTLGVFALTGSVALLYAVYYFTTYTYVLTTNPAPYRNSLLHHFPCDAAILENRFTLKRHLVEVTPAIPPLLVDGAATGDAVGLSDAAEKKAKKLAAEGDDVAAATRFVRPAPAIVERRLHVNALLHRVYLYLQKSHSLVLVNAQAELNPQRFVDRSNSVGREARASVGFLREDQLLPDPTEMKDTEEARQRRTGWWSWRASPETSRSASSSSSADVTAATAGPQQICIDSEVRLRDAINGYQKGHLYTYEQTITHLVQEKLVQRFYDYIVERGMSEHKGLRRVYAKELVRNGLISGTGVTLTQLVPDVVQFADEVFDDVKAKFSDDVIVYHYSVKLR